MRILGIHDGHNASACLFQDGEVVWVIQEERIAREKNYDGFPEQAVNLILHKENLQPQDIDKVVLNGEHQPKSMDRNQRLQAFKDLSSGIAKIKSRLKKIKPINDLYTNLNNQSRFQPLLNRGFKQSQIKLIEHHTAHAASAYFANYHPNQKTLVLTNDGSGDRICATVSIGNNGTLERIGQVSDRHSIGLLYAMFTFLTGMVPLEHEYKIMGMAPYADLKSSQLVADEFHRMFQVSDDGTSWEFIKGESIYQSLAFFKEFMYLKRFDHLMGGLQLFTEQFLTSWVKACINKTGIKQVALSGGTFMNVKANKCIMELDELQSLFVFPSCGDESNAIGVAYHYYFEHCRTNHQPITKLSPLKDICFGIEFSDEEILNAFNQADLKQPGLKQSGFKYKYQIQHHDDIEVVIAQCLADNHVVARFSGREEFGARSLGNRAILGNPSGSNVIKEINEMIKIRDFWMPFACSILEEDFNRYVKSNDKNDPYYMVMTFDTHPEAEQIIAGIHPYDRTVRPQMVVKDHNLGYWKVLNEFKKLTGIGGVLNTSLNLHGLPLVHRPEDAFEVLERSELRFLAIGGYLISKI